MNSPRFKPTTKTTRELIDFEDAVEATIAERLGITLEEAEIIMQGRDLVMLQCLADDLSMEQTVDKVLGFEYHLQEWLRNAA